MPLVVMEAVRSRPLTTLLAAAAAALLVPALQLAALRLPAEAWMVSVVQKPVSGLLYIILALLVGALVALQLWNAKACRTCPGGTTNAGWAAAFFGLLVGVCPACLGLVGVALPLSASIFLTTLSPQLLGVSVLILLLAVWRLGGFRRVP